MRNQTTSLFDLLFSFEKPSIYAAINDQLLLETKQYQILAMYTQVFQMQDINKWEVSSGEDQKRRKHWYWSNIVFLFNRDLVLMGSYP